jgi:small-conductance mechanosensitive channel
MKLTIYKTVASSLMALLIPVLLSCSVVSSGSKVSSDPEVSAQQAKVEGLKKDLKEAERYATEAKQREKAAKDRLSAAEHELKALEEQAKRRSSY